MTKAHDPVADLLTVPLKEHSTILWRERHLARDCDTTQTARFALHTVELDRAMTVSSITAALDLRDSVTLRELAGELPAPWSEVFESHHEALASVDRDAIPRSLADFLA
jgi:hypothetical protein